MRERRNLWLDYKLSTSVRNLGPLHLVRSFISLSRSPLLFMRWAVSRKQMEEKGLYLSTPLPPRLHLISPPYCRANFRALQTNILSPSAVAIFSCSKVWIGIHQR